MHVPDFPPLTFAHDHAQREAAQRAELRKWVKVAYNIDAAELFNPNRGEPTEKKK